VGEADDARQHHARPVGLWLAGDRINQAMSFLGSLSVCGQCPYQRAATISTALPARSALVPRGGPSPG
jgi:hypothetical protein